jgi:F-type H+-transporting ATPase subunit epsilon
MAAGLPTFLGINLVTPRGVVAHIDTDSVQGPGELGEFELLPGHVPLLTALRPGVLTIGGKAPSRYAVSAGYLQVDPEGAVEILVEQAVAAKDIDVASAQHELKTAEAELAKWGDRAPDGEYQNLLARASWARARIEAVAH